MNKKINSFTLKKAFANLINLIFEFSFPLFISARQ